MRTIEEMEQYVERTGIREETKERYFMAFGELREIGSLLQSDWYRAISLAFEYGRAKGYRAGRKA